MHRVHNLFPADCRVDLPLSRPLRPHRQRVFTRALVILASSSSSRVSSSRRIRARARPKIKSRWKNSGGDALTAWFAPVRFAPCEFSLTVHRLSILARVYPENNSGASRHDNSNFASQVTQLDVRYVSFVPFLFPVLSVRIPAGVALVFNDRVTGR